MSDDLISRAAAIDALDKVAEMFPYRIPGKAKTYRQYNEAWSDAIDAAENALEALPSAQPDVPDINVGDMISRQAAIDMLKNRWKKTRNYEGIGDDIAEECELYLKQVPSAQPGWIPCTPETMPKMTDTYLVQVGINENGEGMHTEVRTADWNAVWKEWYVHECTFIIIGEVTEWMPIPLWEDRND